MVSAIWNCKHFPPFLPNLTLLPCYLWMTLHLLPRHTDYSQGYNPARIQMILDLWRFSLCKMHFTMQEKIQSCLLYTAKFNRIRKMDYYYYYFSFHCFGCPELNSCITRKEERKSSYSWVGIMQNLLFRILLPFCLVFLFYEKKIVSEIWLIPSIKYKGSAYSYGIYSFLK